MAISTPTNKEKLHIIKKKFTINETVVVDDPMDMEAQVLESKVHIITVSSSSVRNVENCHNVLLRQLWGEGLLIRSVLF